MSEHKEPIPSMLYNASVGGHVTNSQQIIDENENKEQSQINIDVKNLINTESQRAQGVENQHNTRIVNLETAVGSGGSVDDRIAAETAARNAAITVESQRAQTAEEQLRTLYNNLQQSQPIPVTALPATGEAGKIYRLAGTTSYSDYMWDGTQFVKMAEYDNAIDDEPTDGSNNLVKSGGIYDVTGSFVDDSEWVYIILDNVGRILFGIRKDGTFDGNGIPKDILNYLNNLTSPYNTALKFLDKQSEYNYERTGDVVDENYIFKIVDVKGKMVSGIKGNGKVVVPFGIFLDNISDLSVLYNGVEHTVNVTEINNIKYLTLA